MMIFRKLLICFISKSERVFEKIINFIKEIGNSSLKIMKMKFRIKIILLGTHFNSF